MTNICLMWSLIFKEADIMKRKSTIALPENFTVTAHTGCEKSKDNSIDSLKVGCTSGADIVEFDLNFDSQGNAVLSHNAPVGGCATLDEAFGCIAKYEKIKVNVDVKKTDNLKAVVACAEKYLLTERIFYTGIQQKDVSTVKQQTPSVSYYLNVAVDRKRKNNIEYLNSLADLVEQQGAIGINLNKRGCSEKLVELFHERNLLVSVWTVNNRLEMQKIISLAPDNITTRYPSKLKKLIEQF